MTQILIVDSNTSELNSAARTYGYATYSEMYVQALGQVMPDAQTTTIAPYEDETADVGDYGAVIFTGSSVQWSTSAPEARPLAVLMEAAFADGLAVFGTCNGMQLAATVLGGTVGASPNGREDGLACEITLTDAGKSHPMMAGRTQHYAMPSTHRDEVLSLPDGAVLLSGNVHSPVQAFAYHVGDVQFWGTQYHLETSLKDIGKMLARRGLAPDDTIADLVAAADDATAAARLGTTPEELSSNLRLTELRNWTKTLRKKTLR
ncbi:MAG: GMP synthase (glutamine-hydrolyzing) [Paracoccaceae bacterium]|jgi:GMP synthase (glutamine-hydrolysing)